MPAAIAMAAAKISPMLAAASKPPSAASSSSCASTINPAASSVSTISIPVSAFHDPASNVITITPYIFVKTATVAEQMQALRQDKKIGKALEQPSGTLRVKRRTDLSKLGLPDAKPASVSRRNARERNRVKQVNLGFETLREHVPNGKKNKKMSKVQTLRSAAQYIKDLYMILHGELPALGSPTVIDENEPDSPIENSAYSISDTDNDASLGSPEPKFHQYQTSQQQQQEQQPVSAESDDIPASPVPSIYVHKVMNSPSPQQQQHHNPPGHYQRVPQQQQQQQTSIVKTEYVSVLQQQLCRGQLSHGDDLNRSMARQQQVKPHHQEQHLQQQEAQSREQQQQQQQQANKQQQQRQQQLLAFSPSTLRLDPLTCRTVLGLGNASTAMGSATFTELSPISLEDEHCDSYMDVSTEQALPNLLNDSINATTTTTSNNTDPGENVHMDVPASPSLLQSYMSDVNMNVISSPQNDFAALQHYYKSVRNENFKSGESVVTCQDVEKSQILSSFLMGHHPNVVHSPASSLSSTASSASSESDMCASAGQYDYDNLDKEALLDISNWITEICSQGMHFSDTGSNQ